MTRTDNDGLFDDLEAKLSLTPEGKPKIPADRRRLTVSVLGQWASAKDMAGNNFLICIGEPGAVEG